MVQLQGVFIHHKILHPLSAAGEERVGERSKAGVS